MRAMRVSCSDEFYTRTQRTRLLRLSALEEDCSSQFAGDTYLIISENSDARSTVSTVNP